MQCTSCAADLEAGSHVCPYCGSPVRGTGADAVPAKTSYSASTSVLPDEERNPYTDPRTYSEEQQPSRDQSLPVETPPAHPPTSDQEGPVGREIGQPAGYAGQPGAYLPGGYVGQPEAYVPPGYVGQPGAYPFPSYAGQPGVYPPPGYTGQPGAYAPGIAIGAPPLQQRKPAIRPALLLLLIVGALVIAELGGIGYYAAVYHPTSVNAHATAAAQSAITALYNDPHSLYHTVTNQAPAISDPLNDANTHIWDIQTSDANGTCAIKDGAYHVAVTQSGYIIRCSINSVFDDFAFQVQMNILAGDDGGVVFRYDQSSDQYYRLQVSPQGHYQIYLHDPLQGNQNLRQGQLSTFKTGLNQPNLVTVIAQGNKFSIYMNKTFVTSVSDKNYPTGAIALSAIDQSKPAEVAFSNAQLWILA